MRQQLVNFIYDSIYHYVDINHNGIFFNLSNPIPPEFKNNSGLYFFFDSNILVSENKNKIIRVGITGNNGNDRLYLHQNGNINVSIFRKHIGRSLFQLNGYYNENQISEYINELPYIYIPINENIKLLEKTIINILSNRNQNHIIYPASDNWLGYEIGGDVNLAISESHMWNVQHTSGFNISNIAIENYFNILNPLFNE